MYVHGHAARRGNLKGVRRWGLATAVALGASLLVGLRWLRGERRAARMEMREAAQSMGQLFEALDAVVWQIDPATGAFHFLNRRSETLLGYPRQRWMERGIEFFLSIVHPEDRPRLRDLTRECIEGGKRCDVEYRALARDGRVLWLRSLVRPSPDGLRLCGISVDVTEQHRMAEALAASDRRFRSMFDQAAVGIVEVRPDGYARLANERFCAMLGYEQAELAGKHFREVTHPDDLADDLHQADRLARGEIDHYTLQKRFLRRDGKPVWANLTCSAVHGPEGRVNMVVAIVQDITPQKEAEAELRHLAETLEQRVAERTGELHEIAWELSRTEQRERQRIAADLHDELAQLLLAARLKLDVLHPGAPNLPQRLVEARDLISQSMDYVRTLISTLAAAAREDQPLADALHQEAQRIDQAYDLTVHVYAEEPPRPPDVETRDLLLRAAHELLINVAKHARADEAQLTLRPDDQHLLLQVRDNGVGFDPEQIEREEPEASGHFGLRHLRRRLRLMGGQVKLDSKPGAGTEVTVHLPLGESAD
ncbi:MAG: PAS domain-containing sensor histidine kinase [Phycisphaeraceae bacterium]